MIGENIKKFRLGIGLSQRQLAGNELTRPYISMLESGKANPSNRTITLIAERLGVTVAQLTDGGASPETFDNSLVYLTAARYMVDKGDYHEAHTLLTKFLIDIVDARSRLEGRRLMITVLHHLKMYDDALTLCKTTVEGILSTGEYSSLAAIYFEMGKISFSAEDYKTARHSYEQAILYSSQSKQLAILHTDSLMYLGTTLMMLGYIQQATDAYMQAYEIYRLHGDIESQGKAALGMSATYYKDSQLENSLHWTLISLEQFKRIDNSKQSVYAMHNLDNVRQRLGESEEALRLYHACIARYTELGLDRRQASLLEDLAMFWYSHAKYDKAKSCCYGAFELLDRQDNGIIRGRVYRVLAMIMDRLGETERAHDLIRASYDILKSVRAEYESAQSKSILVEIHRKLRVLKVDSLETILENIVLDSDI